MLNFYRKIHCLESMQLRCILHRSIVAKEVHNALFWGSGGKVGGGYIVVLGMVASRDSWRRWVVSVFLLQASNQQFPSSHVNWVLDTLILICSNNESSDYWASFFRTAEKTWFVGCQWWWRWLGDFLQGPGWKVQGLERLPTTTTGQAMTTQLQICNAYYAYLL